MKILVTGSSGHLGEALVRTLRNLQHEVVGVDILPSPFTSHVGSIADLDFVQRHMKSVEIVFHAATLHKPHVATHTRQQFVDTNITGTLHLLETAVKEGTKAFIFTSTTSTFGDALVPAPGEPAVWVTENVVPRPKNIYGATKTAAEDLCQLFFRNQKLPCIILRTSRFFPEADDDAATRATYEDANIKVNELLYRRADVEDVVNAHLLAMDKAVEIGFGRYIISATSPFEQADLAALNRDAPAVVREHYPNYERIFAKKGWKMLPKISRVYVNDLARKELNWQPKYDFGTILNLLENGHDWRSPLTLQLGLKGYHENTFDGIPYPVN